MYQNWIIHLNIKESFEYKTNQNNYWNVSSFTCSIFLTYIKFILKSMKSQNEYRVQCKQQTNYEHSFVTLMFNMLCTIFWALKNLTNPSSYSPISSPTAVSCWHDFSINIRRTYIHTDSMFKPFNGCTVNIYTFNYRNKHHIGVWIYIYIYIIYESQVSRFDWVYHIIDSMNT